MPLQGYMLILQRHCRRKERPAWQLLLGSRDFGAIMLLNAMMFMTQNGSRAVLVPLLATQAFGVTTTTLGRRPSSFRSKCPHPALLCRTCAHISGRVVLIRGSRV